MPKTRRAFWQRKLEANRDRDAASLSALKAMGWEVMIVWECETLPKDPHGLLERLVDFLDKP